MCCELQLPTVQYEIIGLATNGLYFQIATVKM